MKKEYLVLGIVLIIVIVCLPLFLTYEKNNNIVTKISDITRIKEENSNKELMVSKDYDKFTYLEFQNDNVISSYFVNIDTGMEEDFFNLIKQDKQGEFEVKIESLLRLKYPKFIVDALIEENTKRTYQLKDNELVIYFSDYEITPSISDELYLKVNYNEIKDYIDFTIVLDSEYENENGYNYTNTKKSVALTFDDGPSIYTEEILNTLKKYDSHATFFVLGNKIDNYNNTIIKMYDDGNEIGNHSYNHRWLTKLSIDEQKEQINKTQEIIKKYTGYTPIYMRPTYGSINKKLRENINLEIILWSVDTKDWKYKNVNTIVENALKDVKDGSIILMHDTYKRTSEAVKILVPKLIENGYQLVTISELKEVKKIRNNLNEKQ